MPTSTPSSTTGTERTPLSSIRATTSARSSSGRTLSGAGVMTASTAASGSSSTTQPSGTICPRIRSASVAIPITSTALDDRGRGEPV